MMDGPWSGEAKYRARAIHFRSAPSASGESQDAYVRRFSEALPAHAVYATSGTGSWRSRLFASKTPA